MARIRSVHPGLFTDEAWVSCSPLARILYIGLWTDADDQGLFEWKPLQIKMRLLPGDAGDASDLLGELTTAGLIAAFHQGEKLFGAIKDFRKYQRPKKPNAIHLLPLDWRTYVGLEGIEEETANDDEPPVPHQFPTKGEKSPQMEDGGGRKSSEDKSSGASSAVVDHDAVAWTDAVAVLTGQGGMPEKAARALFGKLLASNKIEARDLLPALATARVNGTLDPQGLLTKHAGTIGRRRSDAPPKRVGWV